MKSKLFVSPNYSLEKRGPRRELRTRTGTCSQRSLAKVERSATTTGVTAGSDSRSNTKSIRNTCRARIRTCTCTHTRTRTRTVLPLILQLQLLTIFCILHLSLNTNTNTNTNHSMFSAVIVAASSSSSSSGLRVGTTASSVAGKYSARFMRMRQGRNRHLLSKSSVNVHHVGENSRLGLGSASGSRSASASAFVPTFTLAGCRQKHTCGNMNINIHPVCIARNAHNIHGKKIRSSLWPSLINKRSTRLFSTISYDDFDAGGIDMGMGMDMDETLAFVPAKEAEEELTSISSQEDGIDIDIDIDTPPLKSKSKPKPRGNRNRNTKKYDPLEWSANFGRRSPEETERLHKLANLHAGDEDKGYFDVSNITVPGVTMVRTKEEARIVMKALMSPESENVFHACDTEVMQIDLKNVGPVGNGYVTCLSVYSGPTFDYGLGDGPGTVLWVDNLDDAFGVLQEFKPFFESERFKTVWHNYGFDRHVMWNEGIDVLGFGGDTMHMARLQDTSRAKYGAGQGYSLEALTSDIVGRRKKPMKEIFGVARLRKDGTAGSLVDVPPVEVLQRDPRFRENWIVYSAFDAEGTWLLREELQAMLEEMPWFEDKNLYEYYQMHMRKFAVVLTDMERRGIRVDAKDYLAGVEVQAREDRKGHVEAFRKWAYKMIGVDGLAINPASSTQLCTFLFGGAENSKTKSATEDVRVFKVAREEIPDDAMELYKKRDEEASKQKQEEMAANANESGERLPDEFDSMKVAQLKALCKEYGLKVSGKKSELQERLRGHFLASSTADSNSALLQQDDFEELPVQELKQICRTRGLPEDGSRKEILDRLRQDVSFALELLSASAEGSTDGYRSISEALEAATASDGGILKEIMEDLKAKSQEEPKWVDVTVTSIGMKPTKFTSGGAPSVTADVLRKLAGDPFGDEPKYGTAYEFFGGGEEGHDACVALYSLTAIGSIDTMIANFLTSLQALADHDSRVHGSINLNTETGRLSSRRPNLQNQPALEKDKYQIRKAFQASPGNNLIVADYGQLELRLLASMTNCHSMIEAFEAGGDFHSRTALGMFDYIQQKVKDGECLLEWDYANGEPPKPMLKDMFASERRKAKTLNFSIAYGKTAHGLSQDWGVSLKEAEDMLQAWYDSRPEVEAWQKATKAKAQEFGITRTMMGRYRQLPDAMGRNQRLVGHSLRASINTPIQGGAADVAMMAMNKINDSQILKDLGWILLMQIHDEVILEGPEDTAEKAFEEVVKCMQEPWALGLPETAVPLLVDGSCCHKNWYDAK